MEPIITAAMLSALARLRQRVSYVLMRGGDDAPLGLAVGGGDVVLTLTVPGAAESAVLGYVWEDASGVLYEPVDGGTDDDPLDSDASRIAVCDAAIAAIAYALGGGVEHARTESGGWAVTTPGGYEIGSLGGSHSLAEIIRVGRARLREELAAEISSGLMACHHAAAAQMSTDAWPEVTLYAPDDGRVLASVDYAVADADDAVALTGPDGDRTVIRPDSYTLLSYRDWQDYVSPVCDSVAAALTAG